MVYCLIKLFCKISGLACLCIILLIPLNLHCVSRTMPQLKSCKCLFLCLNKCTKIRNDLTIRKWIPLLLEVASILSPLHPYPWAGLGGLCGHSDCVTDLGEFYFGNLLPSLVFQLCSLHYHADTSAVSN